MFLADHIQYKCSSFIKQHNRRHLAIWIPNHSAVIDVAIGHANEIWRRLVFFFFCILNQGIVSLQFLTFLLPFSFFVLIPFKHIRPRIHMPRAVTVIMNGKRLGGRILSCINGNSCKHNVTIKRWNCKKSETRETRLPQYISVLMFNPMIIIHSKKKKKLRIKTQTQWNNPELLMEVRKWKHFSTRIRVYYHHLVAICTIMAVWNL